MQLCQIHLVGKITDLKLHLHKENETEKNISTKLAKTVPIPTHLLHVGPVFSLGSHAHSGDIKQPTAYVARPTRMRVSLLLH